MDQSLARYLRAHFVERPEAVTPVKDIARAFIASLPPDAARSWTRGRVVAELSAAGYTVGILGQIAHVGGLAPRGVEWRAVDGRLEAAHASR